MHVLRYLDEIRPTDDIPEITEGSETKGQTRTGGDFFGQDAS